MRTFRLRYFALAALLLVAFTLPSLATEISVHGTLERTVEPGGWLIVNSDIKYLLLNARQFTDESWFKSGARVVASGEVKPDIMTSFQQGTPFQVSTVSPSRDQAKAGETPDERRLVTRVMVTGDAVTRVEPDTAILNIAVITQNTQAIDAQQQNATQSDELVRALKSTVGTGGEVKTSGYSIEPQRIYKEGQPSVITGYQVRNSVVVTLSDLKKVGAVIDSAATSGANNIDSVTFTLRNDESAKTQALTNATQSAMKKARALATALGGHLVRVAEVQESGFIRPRPLDEFSVNGRVAMAGKATPIEVGTLEVTSQVQLVAEVALG
jgi:uncharacterized protein YggE